jgi:hypothetical protein
MKEFLRKSLTNKNGNRCWKRIFGAILIIVGLLEKIAVFSVTIFDQDLMVNFINLDSSANDLIYIGCGLLGFLSAVKFFGKNKISND